MKRIILLVAALAGLAMASNPQAALKFRNQKDTTWLTVSGTACTTAYYFADNRFHTMTAAWKIKANTPTDHMAPTFYVEEVQDTLHPPGILDPVTTIPEMPTQWISSDSVDCGPFAFQPAPSRWIRFVIFYTFSSSALELGSFKVTTIESYWPPMAMVVNVTTSGVSGDSCTFATISHMAKTTIRGDSIHTIRDTLYAVKTRVATNRNSIAACSTARVIDSSLLGALAVKDSGKAWRDSINDRSYHVADSGLAARDSVGLQNIKMLKIDSTSASYTGAANTVVAATSDTFKLGTQAYLYGSGIRMKDSTCFLVDTAGLYLLEFKPPAGFKVDTITAFQLMSTGTTLASFPVWSVAAHGTQVELSPYVKTAFLAAGSKLWLKATNANSVSYTFTDATGFLKATLLKRK